MSYFERDYLRERVKMLLDEKRELKQLYREESERIEKEFYDIKIRLAQLDKENKDYIKDTIDYENTLIKLTNVVDNLSKLIPQVPVENVIQKFNEKFEDKKDNIIEEKFDKTEINELKDKEKVKLTGNIGKNYKDIKIVADKIAFILKEAGQPLKSSKLEEILNKEYGWHWNNFTNTINRVLKYNNKIQKATRGYYQYIG